MDALKLEEYTVQDIFNLPEGKRAELIDGVIYDMATPSRLHQRISGEIYSKLRDYIKEKGGDCQVYYAPFAVFLNEDDRNYFEPDLVVVCDPKKLTDKGCNGAPDLVVEITSPSTKRRDLGIKMFKYRTAGVREYWVINPDARVINTFHFDSDRMEKDADVFTFDEEMTSEIFQGFSMVLSEEL